MRASSAGEGELALARDHIGRNRRARAIAAGRDPSTDFGIETTASGDDVLLATVQIVGQRFQARHRLLPATQRIVSSDKLAIEDVELATSACERGRRLFGWRFIILYIIQLDFAMAACAGRRRAFGRRGQWRGRSRLLVATSVIAR
jgi:hypothetical protein